jgi:hypothetical protein
MTQDVNAAYNVAYDHGFRAGTAVSADRIEALEAVVVAADNEIKRSHIDADQLRARIEALEAALRFYANPETYHAIAMLGDRPCGEFADDFSEDEWTKESGYHRPMPGKIARAALAPEQDK